MRHEECPKSYIQSYIQSVIKEHGGGTSASVHQEVGMSKTRLKTFKELRASSECPS